MVRQHPQWQEARRIAASGRIGETRAMQTFFSYFLVDPGNVRNQADIGGGGLYDIGCYAIVTARYVFGAEPTRVIGLFDRDPEMRVDRMTSAILEFPGGRHLTFTCATQLSQRQRVIIVGTKGRVEVLIPFNAPPDQPCRLLIDDGKDLSGAGASVQEFPVCNQYTLQGDMFSRAVLGEAPLDFPIEDAVLNMRVIDALFRSGESGRWERP
jgi:predicted dehydrogenase